MYVPIRQVDVQAVMKQLRIRYTKPVIGMDVSAEDFEEEKNFNIENVEIECYDMSVSGYIGVPRQYALEKLGLRFYVDRTVRPPRTPEKFVRQIKARDNAQREFMDTLAALCGGPSPVDVIANARTGTGKTVAALWTIENAIQAPTLVTVPTVYLLNQWRDRIVSLMGRHWFDLYAGHIQQGTMDYRGRLITLGLAPSLARRDYPLELRRYFKAIFFDEWHKVPTPSIAGILAKYPASIRVGFTATNRKDALAKVAKLHMGSPRVISKQEVMHPDVFVVTYNKTLPRQMPVYNERVMLTYLSKFKDRNLLLSRIIYERGYQRGRTVIGLSDRTEQLQDIQQILRERFAVPEDDVAMIVGQYVDRDTGKKIKMSRDAQAYVAEHVRIKLGTYGLFDTGADVPSLDMGVELTPRGNVEQAVGRVLRILEGKQVPEWYSVRDNIMVYSDQQRNAPMFSPDTPEPYAPLLRMAEARLGSYYRQRGTVRELAL